MYPFHELTACLYYTTCLIVPMYYLPEITPYLNVSHTWIYHLSDCTIYLIVPPTWMYHKAQCTIYLNTPLTMTVPSCLNVPPTMTVPPTWMYHQPWLYHLPKCTTYLNLPPTWTYHWFVPSTSMLPLSCMHEIQGWMKTTLSYHNMVYKYVLKNVVQHRYLIRQVKI